MLDMMLDEEFVLGATALGAALFGTKAAKADKPGQKPAPSGSRGARPGAAAAEPADGGPHYCHFIARAGINARTYDFTARDDGAAREAACRLMAEWGAERYPAADPGAAGPLINGAVWRRRPLRSMKRVLIVAWPKAEAA